MPAARTTPRPDHIEAPLSKPSGRKRAVALLILVLAAIWLVAFILSNSETVKVSFVFGHVKISLIWVMIICAGLGVALTWAIPRVTGRSGRG